MAPNIKKNISFANWCKFHERDAKLTYIVTFAQFHISLLFVLQTSMLCGVLLFSVISQTKKLMFYFLDKDKEIQWCNKYTRINGLK